MKFYLFIMIFAIIFVLLFQTASASDILIIEDFDSDSNNITWTAGNAVSSIIISNGTNTNESSGKVLAALGSTDDSSLIRTISADFDVPVDLSDYKYVSVSLFVDGISGADDNDCFFRMTLHGLNGEQFESISGLKSGKWQEISADISKWKEKSSVVSIEFGVVPVHIESGIWDKGFIIDNLLAHDAADISVADRFLFENFTIEGGELSFAKDKSFFELSCGHHSNKVSLEFDMCQNVPDTCDTLRIALENLSDAKMLNVSVSRENDMSYEIATAPLSGETGMSICTLNIKRPWDIDNLRLEIPITTGKIKIHSIQFTSTYSNTYYTTYGSITECSLSSDGKSITISGELPREYVTKFSDCKFYLYSLEPNENARNYSYEDSLAIATHGISTKFSFNIPTSSHSDTAQFKKYVVMISTQPKVFLDTPVYITSNEKNESTGEFFAGVCNTSDYTISQSCSSATIVDVYIDKLLSSERTGFLYSSGGSHYYFNNNYIEELNRKFGACKAAGISTSVRLMIGSDKFEEIIYDNFGTKYDSYFPDTSSAEGYAVIKAVIEYLTEKYSGSESAPGVDSFIIGKAVNTGNDVYFAPQTSMTEFVHAYAGLLRFTYICASDISDNIRVYASVGNVFEYSFLESKENRFDTKAFAEALASHISDEGSFPWGICIETYDAQNTSHKVLSPDMPGSYNLLSSISVFSNEDLYIPIIVADHLSHETNIEELTAKRLLNAAKCKNIDRYIFSCEEEHVSGQSVADILKAFMSENTDSLSAININEYKSIINNNRINTCKIAEVHAQEELQFTPKGKYLYFEPDSYKRLNNVWPLYNTGEVKLSSEQSRYNITAHIQKGLTDTEHSSNSGIAFCFEQSENFSYTPTVSLEIKISDIAKQNVTLVPVVIRFTGKNFVYDVNATLQSNTWQTIYADMSGLEQAAFHSVQILIDSEEIDSANISVANITGYSGIYSDTKLSKLIKRYHDSANKSGNINPVIVSIFIIIISALITSTTILVLKSKKSSKTNFSK